MSLEALLAAVQKKFKKKYTDAEVSFELATEEKPVTGVLVHNPQLEFILDRQFISYGRFYLFYGKKGSSKTSLFYEFAKIVQAQGGDVIWLETENAADLDYAVAQGVDPTKMVIQHPQSLEQALTLAEYYIRAMPDVYPDAKKPLLICLDSIAGATTEYELDDTHTVQDTKLGEHARLLSRFYRELEGPLAREKCIFITTNQLKEKIGMTGWGEDSNDAMIGGHAPTFHSTYQYKIVRTKDLIAPDAHGAERKIGSRHLVTCKRNKLGREGKSQSSEFDLFINGGIDWFGPLVRRLGEHYNDLVKHVGAGWFEWVTPGVKYTHIEKDATGSIVLQEERDIPVEDGMREAKLAEAIKNSPQAQELIRKAFGIRDLPSPELMAAIDAERLDKRKKKKKRLDDEEDK